MSNQLTVAGVISVTGQHVLLAVEGEPRQEAEPAVTLLQLTAEQTVRGLLRKRKSAILTPAPVTQYVYMNFPASIIKTLTIL